MAEGKRQKAEGLPEGWQFRALGELLTSIQGGFSVNASDVPADEGQIGILKISSVLDGVFKPEQNKGITDENIEHLSVSPKADSVIISRANTKELVGMCGYVAQNFPTLFLPDLLWQLQGNPEQVSMRWFSYWLSSPQGREKVTALAAGSNASMVKINKESFRKLSLLLPPLPEQRKIAAILSTWDDTLATLGQLLEAKRQQKRGLAEALLTGKKRLPGFEGEWEEKKLGDVLFEPKQDAEKEPHKIELLTVKLHVKGIEKSGKFPAKTKAARPYYKRFEGEILIGRQNFHNGGVGIVKPEQSGLIASNAISSYLVKGDDLEFVFYSISREIFYSAVDDLIGGTGQKEISRSEFARLRIPVPPLPEQQAIASILSALDGEIASLEALKAKVQEQKRGLMDELLTGRVRVRVQE